MLTYMFGAAAAAADLGSLVPIIHFLFTVVSPLLFLSLFTGWSYVSYVLLVQQGKRYQQPNYVTFLKKFSTLYFPIFAPFNSCVAFRVIPVVPCPVSLMESGMSLA